MHTHAGWEARECEEVKRCVVRSGGGESGSGGSGARASRKKPRLVWTAELHARFMNAVNNLVSVRPARAWWCPSPASARALAPWV